MRASMRGSMRKVMVTESESSLPVVITASSINRTSIRLSAQNAASASSRSKIGISSQLEMAFILVNLLRQGLVQFALVKIAFLRLEGARENHAGLFAVGAVKSEDARTIRRRAEIEKP